MIVDKVYELVKGVILGVLTSSPAAPAVELPVVTPCFVVVWLIAEDLRWFPAILISILAEHPWKYTTSYSFAEP